MAEHCLEQVVHPLDGNRGGLASDTRVLTGSLQGQPQHADKCHEDQHLPAQPCHIRRTRFSHASVCGAAPGSRWILFGRATVIHLWDQAGDLMPPFV
jgi:hypothetical protein